MDCSISANGHSLIARPLLIAIANARQYGNGALLAPEAQLDDGKLDLVVVNHRPAWQVLMHAPKLFAGTVARVPGVSMTRATNISVSAESPLTYHVDGEPHLGGVFVKARVHPKALRVVAAPR